MRKRIFIGVLFILLNFIFIDNVLSWDDNVTHKDLSKIAAENSVLSSQLRKLGYDKELLEEFRWEETKTVTDWLQEGAKLEDSLARLFPVYGTTRSFNHFHNPLKPWDQAGLNDTWTGKSSLLWAQDGSYQSGFPEGDWSWQKTRLCYYYALTVQKEESRQANFDYTQRAGIGIHYLR